MVIRQCLEFAFGGVLASSWLELTAVQAYRESFLGTTSLALARCERRYSLVVGVSSLGRLDVVKKMIAVEVTTQVKSYSGTRNNSISLLAKRILYLFLHGIISWLRIILVIVRDSDLEL